MAFPVSARFRPALAQSWQISNRVDVLSLGTVIYSPLAIQSGHVTIDRNANYRRSCVIKIVDPTGALTPKQMGDLLSPYGNELALYRGLTYGDGTSELCPLGIFRIATARIKDDTSGAVTAELQGIDRSKYVGRQDFVDVYQIAGGTNVNTAISGIITPRVPPGTALNLSPTSVGTPTMTHGIGDTANPWKVCLDLAALDGAAQLYFDNAGSLVKIPEPDPKTASVVATYSEGVNLIEVDREMSEDKIYNHVVVHNEDSSFSKKRVPVKGEAKVTDPTNPMYVNGPFGDVVVHFRTPLASDTNNANAIAAARLKAYLGKLDSIVVAAIPDPSLDINDVISISRARSGLAGNYVIDAIEMPMDIKNPMRLTVRAV